MKSAAQCLLPWTSVAAQAAEASGNVQTHVMEHRWGRRRPCRARVCVSAGGGVSGGGRLRNVSLSGAFIETALPLPLFAQIAVAVLHDDPSRHGAEFTATVTRREQDGVGIEWDEAASMPVCRMLGCPESCAAAAECAAR